LEEADCLRQQGSLDRAETICHALVRRHPGYVAALHTPGLVCLDKKNPERALDCLIRESPPAFRSRLLFTLHIRRAIAAREVSARSETYQATGMSVADPPICRCSNSRMSILCSTSTRDGTQRCISAYAACARRRGDRVGRIGVAVMTVSKNRDDRFPAQSVDVNAEVDAIKCPTLVVATDSAYRPLSQVTPWQSRIPNSRLATIPSGGFHPAAVVPDLCAETALSFLREVDKSARAATEAA